MDMRNLFLTAGTCPICRADMYALFGKYLPRYGNPDQTAAPRENGAGLCFELGSEIFAEGVIRRRLDKAPSKGTAARGPRFISRKHGYQIITGDLLTAFRSLIGLAEMVYSVPTIEKKPSC